MKKSMYIILILILLMIFVMLLPNFCNAKKQASAVDYDLGNLDDYRGDGDKGTKLKPIVNNITGIITSVGSLVSIVALIIIGIRYMLGSIEERAEYKKTLLPYAIGAVLIFAITVIPSIIYDIAQNI